MRTAFETISESYVNRKRIKVYFRKGQHKQDEINANVFFCQALMQGNSVEEAKEKVETEYPGIKVSIVELKPIKIELHEEAENWKVWFDYLEEST